MKKMFVCMLAFAFAGVVSTAAAEPVKFKKVKILNHDFSIESAKGVIGWGLQSRQAPGIFTVVKSGDGNYLSVTPEKSTIPNNNRVRTPVMSTTKFTAVPGDKVKISLEMRSPEGGSAGVMIWDGRYNQWATWKRAVGKEWQQVSLEYTIKPGVKDPDPGASRFCQFALDVWDKPVFLRNVKVMHKRENSK